MISIFQFVVLPICCFLLLLSLKSTTTTTVKCAAFVSTTTTTTTTTSTIVPSRTFATATTTVARVALCKNCNKESYSLSLSLLNSNQHVIYQKSSISDDSIIDISNNKIKNTQVTVSKFLVSLLFLVTTTSIPVYALDPYTYTNDYNDPLHPLCKRHIEVLKDDSSKFHYTGTAVGPKNDPILRGCTSNEIKLYTLRIGQFDGYIIDNGNKISAGDNIHEGIWEPAYSVSKSIPYYNVDGIRWNDGNKWTVKK